MRVRGEGGERGGRREGERLKIPNINVIDYVEAHHASLLCGDAPYGLGGVDGVLEAPPSLFSAHIPHADLLFSLYASKKKKEKRREEGEETEMNGKVA